MGIMLMRKILIVWVLIFMGLCSCNNNESSPVKRKMPDGILRAGDEARTRNLFLGKEMFYQLNYARDRIRLYVILITCQLQKKIITKIIANKFI